MQSDALALTSALIALHAGETTPQELTESCFRQIERLNSRLNAFITVLDSASVLEAQLPATVHPVTSALRGIPIALKDLFDTAGIRTTAGSLFFANHVPDADAFVVEKIKQAGAIANSKDVRSKLVQRSRYEVGNNGYADGIAQTYATDLVGIGPKLRMQTGSVGFNRLVEFEWNLWSQAVKLRRKLWCQAHAKYCDGEGFGVARTNPSVRHPVQHDYVLYETEQFQTPYLPWTVGYTDGLKFDEFGNPEYWDLLTRHPGGNQFESLNLVPERVPARYVMQWFLMRRPGQHRGVPESSSTLNSGAAAETVVTYPSGVTAPDQPKQMIINVIKKWELDQFYFK